ncbi:MAG TPA: di-heme oxidoredictase family protein [Chloroflexota bacterium]
MVVTTSAAWATFGDLDLSIVRRLEPSSLVHLSQGQLRDLVATNQSTQAFTTAFEHGDELFATVFTIPDGVGAYVSKTERFTRLPRADLTGPGEWATHTPKRATGPNAQSCTACHGLPVEDGAGGISSNAVRDPTRSGSISNFIQRNTPHTFALGALQRLAEEMTVELQAIRSGARDYVCTNGGSTTRALLTKGTRFGTIKATRTSSSPCQVSWDTSNVQGIDADLIVRPFQWKGSVKTVREFVRDAAHNELGMQGVEIVGFGVDGDSDGVTDELSIGDITSLTIYQAAQPRPTTRTELAALGLATLATGEAEAITRGNQVFRDIGCAACHQPRMYLDDPIFSEPSRTPSSWPSWLAWPYRDAKFPTGQDPVTYGVDPANSISFDLTRDQPDNRVKNSSGLTVRLGSFRRDGTLPQPRAIIELLGDLKRHSMGIALAEPIKDDGVAEDTFMTENLWGVGSTAPYMHDGRASTLTEAIHWHGGEAEPSRNAFFALTNEADQKALIAFLNNQVLFKVEAG